MPKKRSDNRIALPDGTRIPKVKNLCIVPGSPFWYVRRYGKRMATDIPLVGKSQLETQGNWRRAQAALLAEEAAAPKPEKGCELIDGEVPTLGNYAPIYTRRYLGDHAESGRPRDEAMLARFVAAFGTVPLSKLTAAMIVDWRVARRAMLVPRTTRNVTASHVNREVDFLKGLLTKAVKDGYLTASPLVGLAKLRTVKRPVVALTTDQIRLLLASGFRSPQDRALAELALHSFARLGNTLNVQWRDFRDTDNADVVQLHLDNTKNGTRHIAKIPREIYDRIVADVPRVKGQPYVFWHRRTARNPDDWRSIVRKMFWSACKRVGIPYGREHRNADGELEPGVVWHGLRRSAASLWLARGASVRQVMDQGNWKSSRVLEESYLVAHRDAQNAMVRDVFATLAPQSHQNRQPNRQNRKNSQIYSVK